MAGRTIVVFSVPQTVCTAEHCWCKELNTSQIFLEKCVI